MGRKKRNPILEELEIIDAAAEGKSIAKYNDKIVFVINAVPGDVVDVQVTKKRKKYNEAYPIKFHKYSENRIVPFCDYFGICGGCKWQNMKYEDQLFYKQKQVKDTLERIGNIDVSEINDIVGAQKTEFYRNKLEFTFSKKRWLTKEEIQSGIEFNNAEALGFHVPKRFDKIIDVEKCYLQEEPSNKIRNRIREFTLKNNYDYYNIKQHEGYIRNLVIRTSSLDEVMLILSFNYIDEDKQNSLLNFIKDEFPEINSLVYFINDKLNDTLTDLEPHFYAGEKFIKEKLGDLYFKISPKSFFQTNHEQAVKLYDKVKELADLKKNEIVYDLYAGTGTISNYVAGDCEKVIGIEYVEEAINDAKENSLINNIKNTDFYAGDMKDILDIDFINKNGKPDLIITDPPRAGMHKDVIDVIRKIEAKKIVYVSCNPATQARDIDLMSDLYKLKEIQPFDMFPHTHHVESVVLLEKAD